MSGISTAPALRFDDVTLGYDRHPVVHHLSGDIPAGSLMAVTGPNGAGKSTLLKAVAGALAPISGRIDRAQPARLAYLPQLMEIDRGFPISVDDLVSTGLWRRTGLFGGITRADRRLIDEALASVGLTGFERRSIGSLSGGQMQRALFARLLLQDADLILLDEPLTAIDAKTAADLMAIVRRWHGEKRTVIAVLHDLDVARAIFPQTLLIARELVAWGPTAEVLTGANLLRARRMIEAPDPAAPACRQAA